MAALIYQVVLQKIFSYVLGGTLLSMTIVVAAYMSGLALLARYMVDFGLYPYLERNRRKLFEAVGLTVELLELGKPQHIAILARCPSMRA